MRRGRDFMNSTSLLHLCDKCHKNDNTCSTIHYFMLSGRISRYIGESIFPSYTGTTSENTDFHVLVAKVN